MIIVVFVKKNSYQFLVDGTTNRVVALVLVLLELRTH
jgi:hypothetical protein